MNTALRVAVLLLFALALFGSAWYIAFRLRTTFGLQSRWRLRVLVIAALAGWFTLMVPATKSADVIAGLSYVLGGYLFAGYIFLTLAFVLLHVIIPKARAGSAALLLAAGATLVGGLWANRFSVVETEIALTGLDREVVAMQLSDIHLGHHRGRKYLEQIVEETNQRKPDIVLITGDLIDSEAAFVPGALEPLVGFSAPVYYVGGNHEKYVDAERAFALIKKYGVNVLRNQVVETHGLQLVGLDYMNADEDTFDLHPSDESQTIKSVLASLHLKNDMPSVLLHHSPAGAQYAAANGIDLMIAGHTHGGQFFPGTLVAAAVFPFTHGLYHRGPLQVFVSQGAGTYMSRVRLGTSNELNVLRLRPTRQTTATGEHSPNGDVSRSTIPASLPWNQSLSAGARVASSDAGSTRLKRTRMMHRIERSTNARGVTFVLSGEMDGDHVAELEALMTAESNRPVFLDLADVTLVNREAIEFLARVETAGAVLIDCPEYVRSWIDAEQGDE